MSEENEKFTYSYAAPTESERREIEDIKKQYDGRAQTADSLTRLRTLDRRVKRTPKLLAVISCVAAVLLFGFGLTLVLEWGQYVWGIIVMLAGVAGMVLVKPLHAYLLKRSKLKYGDEILRLSKELLNE